MFENRFLKLISVVDLFVILLRIIIVQVEFSCLNSFTKKSFKMFFAAFFMFSTFHSFFNLVMLTWCFTRRIKMIFKIVRLFRHCRFQIFFILIFVSVRNVDKSFFISSWNHVNSSLTVLFSSFSVVWTFVQYFWMTNFRITRAKMMIRSKVTFISFAFNDFWRKSCSSFFKKFRSEH